MTLTLGSLFAGFGALDMAVEEAFGARTAWVSEIDPGACKVLAHRFPDAPSLGDITAIDWATVPRVDIITGGSPCQDLSTAGRRAGMTDGTRSNLWVAMREAIAQLRPRFVVWENVRGALSAHAHSDLEPCAGCVGDEHDQPSLRALGRVLGDLAELGFDAEWRGLRASDVGACHQRFRVFVLAWRRDAAHADGPGRSESRRAEPVRAEHAAAEYRGADALSLLPTPRATDGTKGGPGQRGSKGDLMLPSAVALLPTPSASVANDGEGPETWLARREDVKARGINGNGMGMPLTIAVQLLPTVRVENNENRQSEGYGGVNGNFHGLLTGQTPWGQYAPAIARQEQAFGYPAPSPTEPGKNGRPRLSAEFASWMMGAPPGWITDTPGVTRNEALRMAGNGVVQQQALAALTDMQRFVPAGTDTYAIGRFTPGDPTFRAQFPGSPERTTRAAAERDMCRWRAERQPMQGQESLL